MKAKSARIPRAFIDDILNRVDIVEVIDSRVQLKKKGANYGACCPFHNENTPSFSVSQTKQFYYCFGCGVSGNAISFLMEYDKMTFVEAVKALADKIGVQIPQEHMPEQRQVGLNVYEVLDKAKTFYTQQLAKPAHQMARDYMTTRGISDACKERYAIGYAPPGWDNLLKHTGDSPQTKKALLEAGLVIRKDTGSMYDRFRDRLMFPIRDRRGRTLGFGGRVFGDGEPKYLNSPETTAFQKGRELYGLYEALQAARHPELFYVVEGYMDVVALADAGIDNAVATLGTATSAEHIHSLFRYASHIVFCFDGDRAGREAAWRALKVTLPLMNDGREATIMFMPEGDDPDTYVKQHSQAGFEALRNESPSLIEWLFERLLDKINTNSLEGVAKFINQALPLLGKLPAGVLADLAFERLAKLTRTNVAELKSRLSHLRRIGEGASQDEPKAPPVRRPKVASTRRTPMQLLVSLILQFPEFAAELPNDILYASDSDVRGLALLQTLVLMIREQRLANTGAVLECWRDKPEAKMLTKLALIDYNLDKDSLLNEFKGAVGKVEHELLGEAIERLMTKAALEQLTDAEKVELNQLLMQQQRLA